MNAVVIPSSMKFYTPLVPRLIERNPPLAQQVINVLNYVDRDRRNYLFQQVLGSLASTGNGML